MSSNPRTTTFLFTDLEGSTPLWEQHPDLMQQVSARHDVLLREAVAAHRGKIVKTTGDGFHAVFEAASDGLAAALAAQRAIIQEAWPAETGPLRVRMGLHTGESWEREGDYYGPEVNRAARIMGIAHGGQLLLSEVTAALVHKSLPDDVSIVDLGAHHLRGIAASEEIFQLCHPSLPADFPPLKSLSMQKHNLPLQLTSFVGRDKEMGETYRLLQGARLLTMLGPGGTGKTRLMLECAREMLADFGDGVWLVELASLAEPDLLDERVAAVFQIQEQSDRTIRESLVDYLRRKNLLLLLDNVEHMVHECAGLATHLLMHCPRLKILATGREALHVPGEVLLQIPSLSLPAAAPQADVAAISASEAVQLFLDRAQAIRPGFELDDDNAASIAHIVRQLDGIPLALELVTARLRMLSVDQIGERLADRFRLLTGGRRTALPHQQTLQALIDWSWNLLDEDERRLLRRLSVFSGGWTAQAAHMVTADVSVDEYDTFDLLEQLVNKSLVTVKYLDSGEARYGMLESIRHYGQLRLNESGEAEILRERHAGYFVALAAEAGPQLVWAITLEWVQRVVVELDNFRVALKWTFDRRPELALRIVANLFYNEVHTLPVREARAWLERVVEKARDAREEQDGSFDPNDYLKALIGLGVATAIQGHQAQAGALLDEAGELAARLEQPRYAAFVIAGKQMMNPFTLAPERQEELERAIATCRENQFHFELYSLLMVYAFALDAQGHSEPAKPLFREAIELSRAGKVRHDATIFISVQFRLAHLLDDFEKEQRFIASTLEKYEAQNHRRGTVIGQSAMAHLLRRAGRFDEAQAFYRQSIAGWLELGHRSAVAHQLECLAYIAIENGEYVRAARLLGAAGAARERLDARSQDPQEISEQAEAIQKLSTALGEEERDKAVAEGALIGLDDAVQLALGA